MNKQHIFPRADVDRTFRTGEKIKAVCGYWTAVNNEGDYMRPVCKRCDKAVPGAGPYWRPRKVVFTRVGGVYRWPPAA